MAEETNGGVLIGEAGRGGEPVEDVAPTLRPVKSGMNNLKAGDQPDVFKFLEPLPVLLGQLLACPLNRFGRVGIEPFEVGFARTIFVMVSFHAGHTHIADEVEALLGIGVVTDHVPQADVMGAFLVPGVLQDHPQRLEIGVDIGDDCVFHFKTTLVVMTT